MAIRIKSHWYNEDRERSWTDIASALAAILWRIALDRAIQLHGERFIYQDDAQRLAVIREYLYFQAHLVDRLVHARLNEGDRRTLVVGLALKLAGHAQDNGDDLLGPGEHGQAFIEGLNQRGAEYAELGCGEDGPSYPFLRLLGHEIQGLMGNREENRWVIDQVMDRDGPEIHRQLARALEDVLG